MDNQEVQEILRKPAIKTRMGNWAYYMSSLTYKQLKDYVKMPKEVCDSEELSKKIQRELTDNVDKILTYLQKDNDRFFNALVLAVFEGKPTWFPGVFEKDEERFNNIGLLVFSGKEKIFPVDGQHRLAAIKKLVGIGNYNEDEEVPVIFVAHQDNEAGNERTRRLFTSLNRYAKPVGDTESIALDEDDIVAITTRYLIEQVDLFKGKISISQSEMMPPSDNVNFTNIITLDKCNNFILDAFIKLKNYDETIDKEDYRRYRQDSETIESFEKFALEFWEKLIEINEPVKELFEKGCANSLRGTEGGNLLFRPRGLCPYVEAVVSIYINEEDTSYEDIMKYFTQYSFELSSSKWIDLLWNGSMSDPGRAMVRDLFIYIYNPELLTQRRQEKILNKYCERKHIEKNKAIQLLTAKGK